MPQINWQKTLPGSATQSEAPQVRGMLVPQKNWQTTPAAGRGRFWEHRSICTRRRTRLCTGTRTPTTIEIISGDGWGEI
jgi:hypothetical protein